MKIRVGDKVRLFSLFELREKFPYKFDNGNEGKWIYRVKDHVYCSWDVSKHLGTVLTVRLVTTQQFKVNEIVDRSIAFPLEFIEQEEESNNNCIICGRPTDIKITIDDGRQVYLCSYCCGNIILQRTGALVFEDNERRKNAKDI